MRYPVVIPAAVLLSLLAPALAAQTSAVQAAPSTRQLAAQRLSGTPPRIDGRLDDSGWALAQPGTGFTQREPRPGLPAEESTEVRVLYDQDALYVAMRMSDTRAESIASPLARRDASVEHSDWAYVLLDSRGDHRTGYVFAVNPREVQKDFFVYDDSREDLSWDAVWSVATRVDSAGWTAEFRIPLTQIRFTAGQTTWGVNFGRYLARRGERSFWSPWLPDAPGYVSNFGTLTGLTGLSSPRRMELLPYAVGRVVRAPSDPGNPFHRRTDPGASLGLDLSYGLSSNFTLTATANPDFGQVEADPAQVNLTAFETRFEERRPFFIEGTDILRFGLAGGEDLFYTRRIGRAPQGRTPGTSPFRDVPEASTILGAAKVSGKTASGWSLGFLGALAGTEHGRYITADGQVEQSVVEPLTGYGVGRAVRAFRGGGSSLGAILTVTQRSIQDEALAFLPNAAYVGGVDGRHRFGGEYEVRGYAVGSHVLGDAAAIGRLQRSPARYFQRPDAEHLAYDDDATSMGGAAASLRVAKIGGSWRWDAEGTMLSPGFDVNDAGYQSIADRLSQKLAVEYRKSNPARGFRRWDARLSQSSDWTFGGERVGTVTTLSGNFELANRWVGYAQLMRRYSSLSTSALRGGEALRTPGFWRPVFQLRTDRRRPVSGRFFLNARLGDAPGDRSLNASFSLEARTAAMELSIGPSVYWNRDPWQYVGQREVDAEARYFFGRIRQREAALSTRLNYTFSPRMSFELYAQPYVNAGAYDRFSVANDPGAGDAAVRYRSLAGKALRFDADADRYQVDLNGDGQPDANLSRPDFSVLQFRSNAVLRWEFGAGSTMFLVWSQGRRESRTDGSLELGEGVSGLWNASSTNVLLLKVSRRIAF